MNCSELENPKALTKAFQSGVKTEEDRALNCFYELFYGLFRNLALGRCLAAAHACGQAENLADEAFSRGLNSFYFRIKSVGFTEGKATVQTAFLSFCLMELKGLLTREERHYKRLTAGEPGARMQKQEGKNPVLPVAPSPEEERKAEQARRFQKAFALLGEQCQQLIVWRKLLELKDEDIAVRSGHALKPASVPQAVYKCLEKLKKLIADTQTPNPQP